ncbi:peptidoglycan DD-metalloendopeptidase family protein [Paraglaciecola hydrolytica]|uniref:Peptidase M23 n=1 Tax=Paraglaciecola hydrolytica TaxID=1799789 RepID=A0A136A225_9ALTE|nr:peptidoglycan DD-metalloendopeptidase family protein [Paraglaciecola hydrolytica]KXI29271.1 peptidase M23 [Paraglaciecola hydrolytica]
MVKFSLKNLPKPHKWTISVLTSALLVLILIPSEPVSAYKNTAVSALEIGKRYDLEVDFDNLPVAEISAFDNTVERQVYKVKKGDNLAKIFARAGLSPQETYRVSKVNNYAKQLLNLLPGESLGLEIDKDAQLQSLSYVYSPIETLILKRNVDNSFSGHVESKQVDTRVNYTQGEIQSSFWNAGIKANLSESQIMGLADIFGWDIDFALELRAGDSFHVMFEERYIDGEFIENGAIVAAQFVNQGEVYTAVRHSDGNFYTPEGRSLRKSFLRAPVNFKYISSNFNPNRFHPIQKRYKPHNGIDYRAANGTPVVAAGDGKVIQAGYNRFNGNYVFIQHGDRYVTKYLHFSKSAVKNGAKVRQGQVIGYVGATGMAEAPHLHYEFLVDGVHRNPRTVTLPKAEPIEKSQAASFARIADQVLQQLNNSKRIMLAMN